MKGKIFKKSVLPFVLLLSFICFLSIYARAQVWQPIPPYNLLWPLWSPVLSPPDPVTGIPTPIINELTKSTVLPVEPALVWDPALPHFYLLYNYIPAYGNPYLKYFDPTIGLFGYNIFEDWPPGYLLTSTNTTTGTAIVPAPISLPIGYENLFLFDPITWTNFWLPRVNTLWENDYGANPYFLTPEQVLNPLFIYTPGIYGLPPIV
jgi:hypothetical protein